MKFDELNILSIGNTIQLVGAIWAGESKVFLCWLPGQKPETISNEKCVQCRNPHFDGMCECGSIHKLEDLDMDVEEWEKFIQQTDMVETEVLAQLEDGKLGKMLLRKNQRQISQNVAWQVYRRDGFKCRYCGDDKNPLTVDHLVLWEQGGPTIADNLFSCCRKCNKTRGNTEYADWLNGKYYKKVSRRLDADTRQANDDTVAKLDKIPRLIHKPKHR